MLTVGLTSDISFRMSADHPVVASVRRSSERPLQRHGTGGAAGGSAPTHTIMIGIEELLPAALRALFSRCAVSPGSPARRGTGDAVRRRHIAYGAGSTGAGEFPCRRFSRSSPAAPFPLESSWYSLLASAGIVVLSLSSCFHWRAAVPFVTRMSVDRRCARHPGDNRRNVQAMSFGSKTLI